MMLPALDAIFNFSSDAVQDVQFVDNVVDNATVGWFDDNFVFSSPCLQWTQLNHVYFQIANVFLLLSYMASGGIHGMIYLRLMLALGSAFLAIWAWLVICAFDTFLWNAIFTVINVVHGAYLLFTLRPVRFDKQVEEVYRTIFEPLKVSKQQFKKVVNCMKSIRPLKRGEHFAVERQTKADTLSLLLSGRVVVTENGQTLQDIGALQFLDSPEWFGVGLSSDDYFQVSIRACEESRVLLWHRDKLKLILLTDPFLQAVFDHILGRDVVHKLVQMKDKIAEPNQLHSSSINESWSDNEKSSLLSSPRRTRRCEHFWSFPTFAAYCKESFDAFDASDGSTTPTKDHNNFYKHFTN